MNGYKKSETEKRIFVKEVEIIDSFLLGVQAVSSPSVAGAIANLRKDNLRWLGDAMYRYAAAWAEEEVARLKDTSI